MATYTRTETSRAVPRPFTFGMESQPVHDLTWVEKYRAALLETDPEERLGRISEADTSLRHDAMRLLRDPREKDAIEEARQVLTLLREGIERLAGHTSWLL